VPTPPPVPASASVGPIYGTHAHGYDISYPQCSGLRSPEGAAFSVVGVNHGLAFTTNPCLAAEWRSGLDPRAVYFNSGYKAENYAKTSADCRRRSQWQDAPVDRRAAYAIGCSESMYSLQAMRSAGIGRPVMIWIDVESSNSWESADLELNRFALQGEIDVLAATGGITGIYSVPNLWRGIVGDWSPAGVVADWVAGRPIDAACGEPGFSGHPVWLAQELTTWGPADYDSDWAC
jgi:hypothetical protein